MSHTNAPEKFHGVDFKRWQQKMLFHLTTMDYVKYLEEDAPIVAELEHDPQIVSNADIWKQADYMCRNYVVNGLQDPLDNVYGIKKTSKELWLSLEKRFSTEDAGTKKFVVCRFLDFLRLGRSLLRHTSVEQAIMD